MLSDLCRYPTNWRTLRCSTGTLTSAPAATTPANDQIATSAGRDIAGDSRTFWVLRRAAGRLIATCSNARVDPFGEGRMYNGLIAVPRHCCLRQADPRGRAGVHSTTAREVRVSVYAGRVSREYRQQAGRRNGLRMHVPQLPRSSRDFVTQLAS